MRSVAVPRTVSSAPVAKAPGEFADVPSGEYWRRVPCAPVDGFWAYASQAG